MSELLGGSQAVGPGSNAVLLLSFWLESGNWDRRGDLPSRTSRVKPQVIQSEMATVGQGLRWTVETTTGVIQSNNVERRNFTNGPCIEAAAVVQINSETLVEAEINH
jgi:hypothetical protein